jgi:hypothetical protein
VTANQAPVTANQAPVTANKAPVTANKAPGIDSQAPGTDNQAPRIDNQAPRTDNQARRTDNQARRTDNQAPRIDNQARRTDNQARRDANQARRAFLPLQAGGAARTRDYSGKPGRRPEGRLTMTEGRKTCIGKPAPPSSPGGGCAQAFSFTRGVARFFTLRGGGPYLRFNMQNLTE